MTAEASRGAVQQASWAPTRWALKVCGATALDEVTAAARGGADHVGLWYRVDGGRHELSRATLARLACACRLVGVTPVLVTFSHDVEHLVAVLRATRIRTIQLHAYQSPAVVVRLADRAPEVTVIKVVHAGPDGCLEARWLRPYAHSGVHRFLLDRVDDGGSIGSTGQRLPVQVAADVADRSPLPVWLAGGLSGRTPTEDVAALRCHPWLSGIDVDTAARSAGRIARPAVQQLANHWRAGRTAGLPVLDDQEYR